MKVAITLAPLSATIGKWPREGRGPEIRRSTAGAGTARRRV